MMNISEFHTFNASTQEDRISMILFEYFCMLKVDECTQLRLGTTDEGSKKLYERQCSLCYCNNSNLPFDLVPYSMLNQVDLSAYIRGLRAYILTHIGPIVNADITQFADNHHHHQTSRTWFQSCSTSSSGVLYPFAYWLIFNYNFASLSESM